MMDEQQKDEQQKEFVSKLKELHATRNSRPKAPRHQALTAAERERVRAKTASRCHLCGGEIGQDEAFDADHVLPLSAGGEHDPVGNYLAAHRVCNATRWHYLPEEFRLILRIGMWARSQMEHKTPVGHTMVKEYLKYEQDVVDRREKKHRAAQGGEPEEIIAAEDIGD